MHSGHVQATDTKTKAKMMMDTKVAKITRSLTLPVISSPTPLREPSRFETIPPGARSDVFLIVLMAFAGPRRAIPGISVTSLRSRVARMGRHHIPLIRQYF